MKNITLSADEAAIEQARALARSRHKTLNQAFREWLNEYNSRASGRLIGRAIAGGNGVVSYQVIQEFLNLALKRFSTPFTVGQAQRFLSVTFRPMFAVPASLGLCSDALGIHSR